MFFSELQQMSDALICSKNQEIEQTTKEESTQLFQKRIMDKPCISREPFEKQIDLYRSKESHCQVALDKIKKDSNS